MQTVAADTDLPEGMVLPFDLGIASGFVRGVSGRVQAVSGTCTHQGCRLNLDNPREQLTCPCDGATFAFGRRPLTHPHSTHPLPVLLRLPVRIEQGRVQVHAPASASGGSAGAG